ncbi:Ribosomal protein lysine methyltransferase [Exserohilum turcicum]
MPVLAFLSHRHALGTLSTKTCIYPFHSVPLISVLDGFAVFVNSSAPNTHASAIWKVTPLFANWIASPTNFLFTTSLLSSSSTVLELGAGVSGIVALSLGPSVGHYIATDQAYVLKLLRQNIAENLETVFPPQRKAKNAKGGGGKRGGNASDAAGSGDRITTLEQDWETDSVAQLPPVDLIVSCDCVYNEALIEPLNSTCAAICKLRDGEEKPTLCLIAQQLRSPDVFETWLKSFHDKFWVWQLPDAMLGEGLREGSGFVVHLGIVR